MKTLRCINAQDFDPIFTCGKPMERHDRRIVDVRSSPAMHADIMACGRKM